jgi:hypothetical protein
LFKHDAVAVRRRFNEMDELQSARLAQYDSFLARALMPVDDREPAAR